MNEHCVLNPETVPWIPLRAGLTMRPLRFEDEGYVLQLKIEPGTVIAMHRHTGWVHALNLSGRRQIVTTGEVVEPGQFVYEPAGNHDSWRCYGEEPCVVHISLRGRVEYLDEAGQVVGYSDCATARQQYLDYCREHDLEPDSLLVNA